MNYLIDLPVAEGSQRLALDEIESADGKRRYIARCRLPINGGITLSSVRAMHDDKDRAGHKDDEDRDGHKDDEDRDGHMEDEDRDGHMEDEEKRGDKEDRAEHMGEMVLEGIASSSSTDWHGTSMSLAALQGMADQFKAGVPYVATHKDAEWMHMLGRTFDAEIQQSNNIRAAHDDDAGYMLKVRTTLYTDDDRSKTLLSLIERGVPVGWSIGGWFTELEVITNDDDEVEAMVVRGVELDHLATTRTPSNPDSYIASIANQTGGALRAARSKEHRHIWKVVETEDSVHVVFGKSEGNWQGMHAEESSTEEGEDERELEEREATPYADLPLADEDMEWDWNSDAANEILYSQGGSEDSPNWEQYARAHLWMDEEQAETRQGYKLPIAKIVDGRLRAVPRAVISAMGALNGARGGVDISDADRREVYDNIQRYYKKWGSEAPELRAVSIDNQNESCSESAKGIDAREALPAEEPLPHAGEAVMAANDESAGTNESSDRLDRIESILLRMAERMTPTPEAVEPPAAEPVVEPAEAPVSDEVLELRSKVAAMEQRMVELARQPMRRGRPHIAHVVQSAPTTAFEGILRSAEPHMPQGSALVSVCREQAGRRSAKMAELPTRAQLEADLRAVLEAGMADGVISNPDLRASWR